MDKSDFTFGPSINAPSLKIVAMLDVVAAGALWRGPSAVRVQIRSRSTSTGPPSKAIIKRPAHWCWCRPTAPPLTWIARRGSNVEGRASQAVYSRHPHHFAAREIFQHA